MEDEHLYEDVLEAKVLVRAQHEDIFEEHVAIFRHVSIQQ